MPSYIDDAVRSVDELLKRISSASATPVMPAPNRWWLDPAANPGPQPVLERAIVANGLDRNAMTSGAFLNPRTGEVLDGRVYGSGSVLVDPKTGRPMMAVDGEMPGDTLEKMRSAGAYSDVNLVRRSVGWMPQNDAVDLPFLATAESGPKHFYARGVAFDSPVMLRNTGGTSNPTLRPRARGSVYGEQQIGSMLLKGREHPVYDLLRIVPRGTDAPGTLLRYGLLAPLAGAAASGDGDRP